MRVKDVMTRPAISVSCGAGLGEAIDLMLAKGLSGLPVVDEEGVICGVLSEGDLLRRVELGTDRRADGWWARLFSAADPAEVYRAVNGRKVSDVMTGVPVTIDAEARLSEAAALMQRLGIKRLPVLGHGGLVGMLSRADFVRALRHAMTAADGTPVPTDDEIRTRIERELRGQPWAAGLALDVTVAGGRVTLAGDVPRQSQRDAAEVAADNVAGVRSVDNLIDVSRLATPL